MGKRKCMAMRRVNKRQRVEQEDPDTVDVKLGQELRELLGEWAKRQGGAVKEVNLISIAVQTMGGTELEVKLEDTSNSVSCLKQRIEDGHGISSFSQQLFLVSKSGDDKAEANVEAKQEPMRDTELLEVDCCVALCIGAVEGNGWDCSSPLISNKIFAVSGEGSSIATKVNQHVSYGNCLWSTRVMESGKHRVSLKLMKGEGNVSLNHFFGLVRDGAAWDKAHFDDKDAWYMHSGGCLYGNGRYYDDRAGLIKEGQIVSMEADLDKGTLRFWVDGKQHGPGFTSGVEGRVRWAAVSLYYKGGAAEIVPTPELQPWTA